ncbi:MAG: prolipoprotein diacylglyceryl transferase [candidate division Zixibacteria bacterium]|nr:prolipoprotein diacylglyceryl transferase [candidate division Zixibacteria bacterium]
MHPELFHIGPIPIRSYGLMLALSFFLGLVYVYRISQRDKKPFEPFLAIAYIMIIGGIVGARLSYVLFHLDEFAGHWTRVFNPFDSSQFGIAGLNLYGGVVLAVVGSFLYCRFKKLSVLETFDYFAPTLGIGLALTRIGCFLNGCCFGTECHLPWAITFPPGSIPYYQFGDTPLHPAQLYSSLYGVILFIALHFWLKKRRFPGQIVAVLFMVEAVFRFAIEYVRYYEDAMYFSFFGLNPTFNQVISVSLFLLGLLIYIFKPAGRKKSA